MRLPEAFRSWIRSRPVVYDRLKRLSRLISSRERLYRLLNAFSNGRRGNVCFLQIGASDGLRNDPIREFVVRDQWSGTFVEPITSVYECLIENYRHTKNSELTFLNAAISSGDRTSLALWSLDSRAITHLSVEQRLDLLRKTSVEKEHVERWARRYSLDHERALIRIDVPCMTCDEVIEKYCTGRQIDLLAVDAEGHEFEILSSLDMCSYHPEVILFESHNLAARQAATNALLETNGYRVRSLGGDAVAISKESQRYGHLMFILPDTSP